MGTSTTGTLSPLTTLAGALASGVIAGVVAFLALYIAADRGRASSSPPAMKAVSPGQDYAALAKAIEALTEKIDGGASGAAVLAEPARRVPVAGGDRPDLGAAAEPMAEILAELSALTTELKRTRTLALGGGLGSQVEAARSAQIVSTEVDRASTLLRSGQGAEFGRRLWLRSVDEVVDLFGFPSSVSRSDAHLSATWSTADNTVSVIFVDGLVAETKTW